METETLVSWVYWNIIFEVPLWPGTCSLCVPYTMCFFTVEYSLHMVVDESKLVLRDQVS